MVVVVISNNDSEAYIRPNDTANSTLRDKNLLAREIDDLDRYVRYSAWYSSAPRLIPGIFGTCHTWYSSFVTAQ